MGILAAVLAQHSTEAALYPAASSFALTHNVAPIENQLARGVPFTAAQRSALITSYRNIKVGGGLSNLLVDPLVNFDSLSDADLWGNWVVKVEHAENPGDDTFAKLAFVAAIAIVTLGAGTAFATVADAAPILDTAAVSAPAATEVADAAAIVGEGAQAPAALADLTGGVTTGYEGLAGSGLEISTGGVAADAAAAPTLAEYAQQATQYVKQAVGPAVIAKAKDALKGLLSPAHAPSGPTSAASAPSSDGLLLPLLLIGAMALIAARP